jgi:hypothetical protein
VRWRSAQAWRAFVRRVLPNGNFSEYVTSEPLPKNREPPALSMTV